MREPDRKSRIREHKENPPVAGVYQIRNTAAGRSLVGSAINVHGRMNRHRFQLKAGSHPQLELQTDWNEHGETSFEFTVLDHLEPKEEHNHQMRRELAVLEELWLERLAASGELFYGGAKRAPD